MAKERNEQERRELNKDFEECGFINPPAFYIAGDVNAYKLKQKQQLYILH